MSMNHENEGDVGHSTLETLHVGFAIAPIIAVIIATALGKEIHLWIELCIVGAVILVNWRVLWLRSHQEKNKELTLFRTFWNNRIAPNRTGAQQGYNVQVAVIESKKKPYFQKKLESRFKKELCLERLKALGAMNPPTAEPLVEDVKLKSFVLEDITDHCLSFKPVLVDESMSAKNIEDDLSTASAVVVVRTQELEEDKWVFKTVNGWGYEHSEAPILIAKVPDEKFPENAIAKGFLWVPPDSKSLPWRLLQRATDRGKTWLTQATYNRAMVWNIFYIFLMCIYLSVIWLAAKNQQLHLQESQAAAELARQKSRYSISLRGATDAIETSNLYRQFTSLPSDSHLGVSYWFRHNGKPYIFVTTEPIPTTFFFENSQPTIIGCGFVDPNRLADWTDGMPKPTIEDYEGHQILDPRCDMTKVQSAPIKAIVCATFNGTNPPLPDKTVGICVYTPTVGNKLLGNGYRDFLWQRAQKFNKDFIGAIESSDLISLAEREGKEPLSR